MPLNSLYKSLFKRIILVKSWEDIGKNKEQIAGQNRKNLTFWNESGNTNLQIWIASEVPKSNSEYLKDLDGFGHFSS